MSPNRSHNKYRDAAIDIVRGVAIFTMVCANLGPLLAEPHSWFFRFYGTFAAPIFVTVAGMMVGYTALKKGEGHDLNYFLKRGLFLIGVGVFIDLFAWGIIPFMTMDVLYLIGIALPLSYLALRLSPPVSVVLTLLSFLITPLLQQRLGYTPYPTEMYFDGSLTETLPNQTNLLNHWIVDGWFPLFPWLAYAFTGTLLARWRWRGPKYQKFNQGRVIVGSLALIIWGSATMYLFPGQLYDRDGYSELFYPPTLGFVILSLGVIVVVLAVADQTASWRGWEPWRLLGEASLLMYTLHSFIIGWVLLPHIHDLTGFQLAGIYAALILILMGCGWGIRKLKQLRMALPQWVMWSVGA